MSQGKGQLDAAAVENRIVSRALALVKELMEMVEEVETARELEARVAAAWVKAGGETLGELLSMRFGKQEGPWRACGCGGQQKFPRASPSTPTGHFYCAPTGQYHCAPTASDTFP